MNILLKITSPIVIATMLFAGFTANAQTWTAPTQTFPDGNVDRPVHQGQQSQTKLGGFNAEKIKTDLWFSTDSGGDGYCFGQISGGIYDFDFDGCITSWDDLMIDPGNTNDTLRSVFNPVTNENEWVADDLLQNDGETVSVKRGLLPGGVNGPDLLDARVEYPWPANNPNTWGDRIVTGKQSLHHFEEDHQPPIRFH
jgi:hypothetical protein